MSNAARIRRYQDQLRLQSVHLDSIPDLNDTADASIPAEVKVESPGTSSWLVIPPHDVIPNSLIMV